MYEGLSRQDGSGTGEGVWCGCAEHRQSDTSWEGDDLWAYCCFGGMAESFEDGGADIEICTWGRESAMSSGGEQGGTYGSRVE